MNHQRVVLSAIAGLFGLVAVGCQTVSPGVTNRVGTIDAMMKDEPDAIIGAADQTMKELGLEVSASRASKLDGALEASTAQGDRIRISVERVDPSNSSISIRYGYLGDQAKSLMILDGIQKHLAAAPAGSATAQAEPAEAESESAASAAAQAEAAEASSEPAAEVSEPVAVEQAAQEATASDEGHEAAPELND